MCLAREHSRRAATGHAIGESLKAAFWHDRWKNNQIGFHNEEVNERLSRYWPTLGIEEGAKAFVPLCGKSLDMHWLRQRRHPVVGVDLSPIAIHDFFSEAEHLTRVLPERVTILMITLEYDQSKMSGPPDSVPPSEVEDLLGPSFEVETLWSSGWVEASPRFRARGLKTRCDTVLRLDRGGRA